ncbi:MAG: hypothetical protein M3478_14840, partial [Planctomycetota bacterium]|nr:hypothetical protein [Planctomycetota bacterium]
HVKRMEDTSPFNGLVITVRAQKGEGKLGGTEALGWMAFHGDGRFKPEQYEHAIDDLRAAKAGSKQFTDNFIALIGHPNETKGLDWFDDAAWAEVNHNVGIIAKIAMQGGCVGIMFDPEEYAFPMWSYARMPEAMRKAHTYDEMAAKARERGQSFIRAINAEFPDLKILCLFGPYIYAQNVNGIGVPRTAEANYNLAGPFYDGIIEAASEKTTLIEGYEQSYGYKKEEEFVAAKKEMIERPLELSKAKDAFHKHVRPGYGLWLDNQSGAKGAWFKPEENKNHFTPAEWRSAVHFALKHADEYVWIYNERALWWEGRPGEAYEKAMKEARTSPAK